MIKQLKNKKGIGLDAAKLSFSNMMSLLISLLSTMLLARFTSKEDYGTYAQITLATSLAIAIFTLGLPNSINFFLPRSESKLERQHFLIIYYSCISVLCLVTGGVLVLCLPFLVNYFHNPTLVQYAYILFLLPLTRVIIQSNSNMLVAMNQSGKLVYYTLVYNSCLIASTLALGFLPIGFSGYMLLYLLVQVIFSTYVYYLAVKHETISLEIIKALPLAKFKRTLIKLLKFSIPLGIGSMVGTLSLELDKLVIGHLLGTNDLAIYTNASRELPIAMLVSSFTAVLLPKLSKMLKAKQFKEAITLWGYSIEIGFALMLFFTLSIITFAPQVIVFLYSAKYIDGLHVFMICTLILVLRSTYFGLLLNISGNTRFILYSSMLSLMLNFVLNYIFYHIFGFIGPAMATVLSIVLVDVVQLIYTCKISDTLMKAIFPWKNLGKILCRNAMLALPFVALTYSLKLGVDNKSIMIAIGLGGLWFIGFIFANKSMLIKNWQKLNEHQTNEDYE